ncbi:MAG: hypothetical protein AB7K09_02140 [Planctomycetota bacterium]
MADMPEHSRHLQLTLDDCDRVTDWMQCVWPASKLDRRICRRLCDAREAARSRHRQRMAVPPSVDLEMPLSVFGLSPRERSLLDRIPIRTLGDLLRRTDRDLLAMPEFTPQELQAIEAELSRHGLRLGMLAGDPAVPLSLDESLVVLEWFRQVRAHWRDDGDIRIAGRIAAWLGTSADPDETPGSAAGDGADDDDDDDDDDGDADESAVSFDSDDIDLHHSHHDAGEPDIDVNDSADDITDADLELELGLALAAGAATDDSDSDRDDQADDDNDDNDDNDHDTDAADDDASSAADAAVEPPTEEPWRSPNDWKPDDPDSWKGTTDDDSESWKRGDDDDGADRD